MIDHRTTHIIKPFCFVDLVLFHLEHQFLSLKRIKRLNLVYIHIKYASLVKKKKKSIWCVEKGTNEENTTSKIDKADQQIRNKYGNKNGLAAEHAEHPPNKPYPTIPVINIPL